MDIIKKILMNKKVSRKDMEWELFQICERQEDGVCIGCPVTDSDLVKPEKPCPMKRNGKSMLIELERLVKQKAISKGERLSKEVKDGILEEEPVEEKFDLEEIDERRLCDIDWDILVQMLRAKGPQDGLPNVSKVVKGMKHNEVVNIISFLMLCTVDQSFLDNWVQRRLHTATRKIGAEMGIDLDALKKNMMDALGAECDDDNDDNE